MILRIINIIIIQLLCEYEESYQFQNIQLTVSPNTSF